MRPLGPVPVTLPRSTFFSAASRLASGLAMMRSPAGEDLAIAGATAGIGAPAEAGASGGFALATASAFTAAVSAAEAPDFAGMPSSSLESCAITVPTFTPSAPSATSMETIVPSSTASNSIVALSVSISAIMSPETTVSPTLTSHLASLPSSMVGERAGILMAMGMAWAALRWVESVSLLLAKIRCLSKPPCSAFDCDR